jgi:hypothetical protein
MAGRKWVRDIHLKGQMMAGSAARLEGIGDVVLPSLSGPSIAVVVGFDLTLRAMKTVNSQVPDFKLSEWT